jgi:uncharacterized protein
MGPDKPSQKEDEFFAREEIEKRKKWAAERAAALEAEERDRLRELHYMKCPKCGMDLDTIDFRGVKVDRCMNCGGTWFDAGEIETALGQDSGFLGKFMNVFR